LQDLLGASLVDVCGPQVAEGFVVSLVVVPADELFQCLFEFFRIPVKHQVEPVLGGPVDPFDLAAGLRMAAGRVDVADAEGLEVFIERSRDVPAAVVTEERELVADGHTALARSLDGLLDEVAQGLSGHVGDDLVSDQVAAVVVDDASHVPALLDQLTQAPASFMADGAYDRAATCDAILARNPFARFIVPPCKGAVPGPAAIISPTQRDLHILAVNEHGRMNWQKATGYNKRSKVEAAISRYKRVIGDTLKSRDDARRATEVAIAVKSLNRMNELGRAEFVRMA